MRGLKMTDNQVDNLKKLKKALLENYPADKLTTLGEWTEKISRISKVRAGKYCTENNYAEISINDIKEDGTIVPPIDKDFGKANKRALESQRLHQGDLVFGFRSKIGKIGLVSEEYDIPVVGNHGMMRIVFDLEHRLGGTSPYVRDYLYRTLITTYLNCMMIRKNGTQVLEPEILKTLPIPAFIDIGSDSKFSVMFNLARKMGELAKKIEKSASDAYYLQHKKDEELSAILSVDHRVLEAMEDWDKKMKALTVSGFENVLDKDFQEL